ncbi:MAG: hypothetical protein NG737_07200 [Omnitrophica bacterium]|nr:hypothetical protein [Candidatus Omnitrophota bacterium]
MKIKVFTIVALIGGFVVLCPGCKPAKKKQSKQKNFQVNIKEPRPEKAISKYYQKILRLEAKSAEDYMNIAFAHYYFGKIDQAEKSYKKAQELYQSRGDQESAEEVGKYLELLRRPAF